ncbi:hypothetical protein GE061_010759 [Apolygus lucorum]|uniref:Uncharacterized protein n=1 Tax=Apolygus lucorum TaxID=248454 RepID=A0A6A4JZG3_APOLU|nr:hypothetical protein GE061_010759 [Apolygus lucorum]
MMILIGGKSTCQHAQSLKISSKSDNNFLKFRPLRGFHDRHGTKIVQETLSVNKNVKREWKFSFWKTVFRFLYIFSFGLFGEAVRNQFSTEPELEWGGNRGAWTPPNSSGLLQTPPNRSGLLLRTNLIPPYKF